MKKILTATVAGAALFALAACGAAVEPVAEQAAPTTQQSQPQSPSTTQQSHPTQPSTPSESSDTPTPPVEMPAEDDPVIQQDETSDQVSPELQNAIASAQSYVSMTAFSKSGLITQLTSEYGEGYPSDIATKAVESLDVNWKAEAVESAESYLAMTSFSRSGLIQQLTSEYGEGFTQAQAEYAVSKVY